MMVSILFAADTHKQCEMKAANQLSELADKWFKWYLSCRNRKTSLGKKSTERNMSTDDQHVAPAITIGSTPQEEEDVDVSAYTLADDEDVTVAGPLLNGNSRAVAVDSMSDHDEFAFRLMSILKPTQSAEPFGSSRRLLRSRFARGHAPVLMRALEEQRSDWKRAFEQLPMNIRLMFINSVQSMIWNNAVEYLLNHRKSLQLNAINRCSSSQFDVDVLEGDLVCCGRQRSAIDSLGCI